MCREASVPGTCDELKWSIHRGSYWSDARKGRRTDERKTTVSAPQTSPASHTRAKKEGVVNP